MIDLTTLFQLGGMVIIVALASYISFALLMKAWLESIVRRTERDN